MVDVNIHKCFPTTIYEFNYEPTDKNLMESYIKQSRKIPNTGWLNLKLNDNNSNNFLKHVDNKQMFYFTHSFACKPIDKKIITSYSKINNYEFCSSVKQNNILGTQFHPEKSHINGLNILKFLKKQI